MRDERDELVLHPVELTKTVVLELRLPKQLVAVSLGLLCSRDVDREALRVPGLSRLVANDGVAVAEPNHATVAGQVAVLELERLAALARGTLPLAHALAI